MTSTRDFLIISILALIALCSCKTTSKVAQVSDYGLEGLWTLSGERIGGRVSPLRYENNTFKMITSDNRFVNFIVTPQGSFITGKGTVVVESDSVYYENVEKLMNGTLDGKSNRMVYEITPKNVVSLKFFIEKNSLGQTLNM